MTHRSDSSWRAAGVLIVLVLATRLTYVSVSYILGRGNFQHFHVEAAALWFVVAGAVLRAAARSTGLPHHVRSENAPAWAWPLFCLASLALYWPVLSIGLLSDDIVLVEHARRWAIGALSPILFRPVPLAAWALIVHAGGGARALHVFNVLLHGTNAWLVARVAAGWFSGRRMAWLAGVLFLALPVAPEAVAWCAGVFDVSATTFVLLAILLARHADTRGTVVGVIALALAALLSKESAVVLPGLILADFAGRGVALPGALKRGLLALVAIFTAIAALRLTAAADELAVRVDRYILQRFAFGAFGDFAMPWHAIVRAAAPWLVILTTVVLLLLGTTFFLSRGRDQSRKAWVAAAWVLLALVPVAPFLVVMGDLQESRYLYLAGTGWVFLLGAITDFSDGRRMAGTVALAVLAVTYAFGTRMHLRPWVAAGALRERIEAQAMRQPEMRTCGITRLENMPDSVEGAYVFRVGGREDIAPLLGPSPAGSPPCVFAWDAPGGVFRRIRD